MADISKITLPSGTTYDIKDAIARAAIAGGMAFLGITTTALTDGSSTTPIVINGEDVDAVNGGIAIYGTKEFIYTTTDNKWHEFGDTSGLKALAYKDSASGSYTPAGTVSQPVFTGGEASVTVTVDSDANGNYTPAGTVSQPTFSGNSLTSTGTYTPDGSVSAPTISVKTAGATATIHNPTKETVATAVTASAPGSTAPSNPVTYYSVSGETLSLYQIGYNTGDSISTSDVTVKTGDAAYESSAPSFTGTEANISVSGTPAGTVSQPTFSGTKVKIDGTTTANGTISQPTFSGTQATVTVS